MRTTLSETTGSHLAGPCKALQFLHCYKTGAAVQAYAKHCMSCTTTAKGKMACAGPSRPKRKRDDEEDYEDEEDEDDDEE